MSTFKLVLVTGATGSQGGAVVQALLSRGHRARALARNVASPAASALREQGVEVVPGDFSDPESLVQAARGADALFAMTTPFERGADHETVTGIAIADAARAAGVGHLIYSSVASANRSTAIAHFDSKFLVEQHIQSSGLPYTIVAPVFFMENLRQPWMAAGLGQGKLAMAMPSNRALQYVAVDDIGAFVAALVERGTGVFGQRFDIAGDERTGEEAAAILSKATGRAIRYEGFPTSFLRGQSEEMAQMFDWFNDIGYDANIPRLRDEFPEVQWHDLEAWARKQDWSALDQPPEAVR